jgi:hypothetical protein
MRMVRKQVYITPEQDKKLKECAQRLGVSEAELIRRGIELVEGGSDERRIQRLAAWKRLEVMMDEHIRTRPEGSGIDKFNRDEVYAERLDRLGRILG